MLGEFGNSMFLIFLALLLTPLRAYMSSETDLSDTNVSFVNTDRTTFAIECPFPEGKVFVCNYDRAYFCVCNYDAVFNEPPESCDRVVSPDRDDSARVELRAWVARPLRRSDWDFEARMVALLASHGKFTNESVFVKRKKCNALHNDYLFLVISVPRPQKQAQAHFLSVQDVIPDLDGLFEQNEVRFVQLAISNYELDLATEVMRQESVGKGAGVPLRMSPSRHQDTPPPEAIFYSFVAVLFAMSMRVMWLFWQNSRELDSEPTPTFQRTVSPNPHQKHF